MRPVEHVPLGDDRELRLLGGIWYELTIAPLPESVYRVQRETRKLPSMQYPPLQQSATSYLETSCGPSSLVGGYPCSASWPR